MNNLVKRIKCIKILKMNFEGNQGIQDTERTEVHLSTILLKSTEGGFTAFLWLIIVKF